MKSNDLRYVRSSDYRTKFIEKNHSIQGFYMCAYCGRIIKKENMEVDHIISVNLSQRKRIYRWLLKDKNVNSEDNLTSSCRKCNRKKSNHGGMWIFLGRIGPTLQPILWIMFLIAIIYFILWFWITQPYL